MPLPLFRHRKQKPTRRLSIWMAALMVVSAVFTSVASPQLLLRMVEEEKVSYATATSASVSGIVSCPLSKTPLKKRGAQYQAQHRFSFLRRVVQATHLAIIPDYARFKTRVIASRRSQFPHHYSTRLLLAENAQCSPRAPPFVLPVL
jgi:hypothetical protein